MTDTDQPSTTTSPDDEPKPARLKVMALVKQTYATVFGNFGDMVKIVWVALVLQVVFGLVQFGGMLGMHSPLNIASGRISFGIGLGGFVISVVMFLILAGVGVAVQRYVLADQSPSFPGFGIGRRELRYFGYQILYYIFIGLVWLVPFAVMAALSVGLTKAFGSTGGMFGILQVAATVAWIIFVIMTGVRLAFVFPALALDREGGVRLRFRHAWNSAKGHTAAVVGASILTLLPWILLFYVIGITFAMGFANSVMQGQMPWGGFAAMSFVNAILGWVQFLLIWTLFAHAYATIEAQSQDAEALDEA